MQRTGRNGRIFRLQWSACGIWLGLFLLASFTGQSQSVRDLIQQHLDTLGGHSVWSNIHSYILEWEEVGRSGGRMLRQTYWKDTACRDDYYIPKRRGDYAHYYRIVNKEQGWIHLPYNAYNTIITLLY